MATAHDYKCSNCGSLSQRELLTVKRVQFVEMGEGGGTKRSRVLAWLCPSCLAQDPDFLREAFVPVKAAV